MRLGALNAPYRVGSRHKYAAIFERLCDVVDVAVDDVVGMKRCDALLVCGDAQLDYQVAKRTGVPYILHEDDVYTMRVPRNPRTVGVDRAVYEREMIEGAAAILFTSEDHVSWVSERYDLPPYEVVHLRPLACDLDFEPMAKREAPSIVYAGGLAERKDAKGPFGYRAYHSIFSAFLAAGLEVHIYPAYGYRDEKRGREYARLGCVVHQEVGQGQLYQHLSRYSIGYQGYALGGPQDYVRACRPNKLWEYQAAGIPTLGFNGGNGTAIYDGRWGVVARSFDEIADAVKRALAMKVDPDVRRFEVMDRDVDKFRFLLEVASR